MSKCRYPEIKRGPDGKKRCRGCGGEIPKRRQTWCSDECYDKYEPGRVYARVYKRSGGKCEECGWDFKVPDHIEHKYGYDNKIYRQAECHHIIPFSEGGETIDDNLQVLCDVCHKKKTKEWNENKARKRKADVTRLPLFKEHDAGTKD